MQNGRIRATQITASSSWDKNHSPNNGRLFFRRTGSRMGAWCARHNSRYQWLSVDFGRTMRVVKIATQGRQDYRQWVTQYYLSYSQDNVYFAEYKQNSARKVRQRPTLRATLPYLFLLTVESFLDWLSRCGAGFLRFNLVCDRSIVRIHFVSLSNIM